MAKGKSVHLSTMKSLRAIFSIAFALLVFVSSSNFSVGLHLCAGKVNGIAFLEHADGCGHQKLPPCHQKMMKGCCEDEMIVHTGQGFHHENMQVHVAPAFLSDITLPPVLITELIPSLDHTPFKFFNYDTPLRSSDRTVIHQVFLI